MKVFLVVMAVVIVLIGGGWAFRYFTAPIEGRVTAQEQIQSAPMMITAYNHFYDLYAAIKSYDPMIQAQKDILAQTTSETDRSRILINIAGITAQKARSIQQYNADAQKEYTIGQFKDKSLPYRLNDKGLPEY